MKAFVTGATGGLGRNLIERLHRDGHQVIASGRNESIGKQIAASGVPFVAADLTDVKRLMRSMDGCDVVFHCAALSSPWGNRRDFFEANVVGTESVISAAGFNGARVVHVSTPSIYFQYADRLNISEFDPLPATFVNHYAATKFEAEERVRNAVRQLGLSAIIIRPRGIFGPYDNVLIPRLLDVARKGPVPLINGGNAVIDLTYVDNVVEALVLAAKANHINEGQAYNITNGQGVILREMLEKTFKAVDVPFKTKNVPYWVAHSAALCMEAAASITGVEPLMTRYTAGVFRFDQTLDITRARNDLGYKPIIKIDEGIERYAQWWKARQ